MILRDADKIVRERQRFIRREIDRRGIAIKAIALDGGWDNTSTVLSYFPADATKEPAIMSVAALYRLFEALPTDLLSLLLPEGFAIVRVPEGVDHDELAPALQDYLVAKAAAHHPESECGPAIGPKERALLDRKVVHLPIVGKVAA